MTTLRDRLRADTAPQHERVDHAYSLLDLAQAGELGVFLGMQRAVLLSVRCRPGRHAVAAEELAAHMTTEIEADLRHLDATPVLPLGPRLLDATAVHYILLGSSLGTRLLHRRWQERATPAAAGAGRYLGLAPPQGAWRALCDDLAQQSPVGADADRIVRDAAAMFDMHLAAWALRAPVMEGALHV
jgi:heme oxygenase